MNLILKIEVLGIVHGGHFELPRPALLCAEEDLVGDCLGSLSSANVDVEGSFCGATATFVCPDLVGNGAKRAGREGVLARVVVTRVELSRAGGVEDLDGGESTVGGIAGGEPENLRGCDGYGHVLSVGLVHGRQGITQSRSAADGGGDRDFQLLVLSLASHGRRFHVVGGLCSHRRLDDDEFAGRCVDVGDGISHSTALVACEQLVEVNPTLGHCIGSTHIEGEPSFVSGLCNPFKCRRLCSRVIEGGGGAEVEHLKTAHVELDHRSSRLLKEDIPDMGDSDVSFELRETRG